MTETSWIKTLLEFWFSLSLCAGLVGVLNIPVLLLFALSRRWQLLRPDFGSYFNAPAHWLLSWICIPIYGVALPILYYVNVRQRHRFEVWELGRNTNTTWAMTLGAVLILWLSVHIAEAALRRGRIRIRRHPLNIAAGAAAVALCGWYHARTIPVQIEAALARTMGNIWETLGYLVSMLVYPQSFFFGASLVYLTLLLESLKRPPALENQTPAGATTGAMPRHRRRWIAAMALASIFVLTMFSPFWLSIPRVSHRQAMTLLDDNRARIVDVSQSAGLDPLLMAGIIYVAHTRDQPRFTGQWIDRIGYENVRSDIIISPLSELYLNPSVGLCQMNLLTVEITDMIRPENEESVFPWTYIEYELDNEEVFSAALAGWRTRQLEQGGCVLDRIAPLLAEKKTLIDDPELSLLFAAAMLKALELHWEQAGHPIAGRPEILATLYNLGYQRSKPKADPRANDFGRRVKAFMESAHARAWLEGETR